MLEPKSGGFAEILDLKKPTATLLVGKRHRLRLSAAVNEAKAQLREYRAWFDESEHQRIFQARYHMTAYKPSVVMVIGRDASADPYELRRLWDEEHRSVTLWTYDELLRRIRALGAL